MFQNLLSQVESCSGFVRQAEAQGNSLGYAMDGELVDAEFLFCTRLGEKKGGYVKVKHLKRAKAGKQGETCYLLVREETVGNLMKVSNLPAGHASKCQNFKSASVMFLVFLFTCISCLRANKQV